MLTDWVLIGRLARELRERVVGARLEDAGLLPDGRIGLQFRRRGSRLLLAIDLFASPPMLTLETGELGIMQEPGFVRVLARTLGGMTLIAIAARRSDRLLRMTFGSRSRFGVGEQLDLYLELVPRFGNAVLVKGDVVVAAFKEFAPAQNPGRSIAAGSPYVLPPLPARIRTLADGMPENGDAQDEPLHVYRRDGTLLQAYVVPLEEFASAEYSRTQSLLEVFSELRAQLEAGAKHASGQRRRGTLLKRLDQREQKLLAEREHLAGKRAQAQTRDELRAEGDDIFARLHTLAGDEREEAKERAATLFARYKKLGKSLPHIDEREQKIAHALSVLETLRWEAERTSDDRIEEVDAAVAELERRRGSAPARVPVKRKRRPLEVRTTNGSRILIGRSPLENAELTFGVARPNDLWFHTRGIPGAHVILARDDRSEPPDEDLRMAASLAAFYSRAQRATSVTVDYTLRKHVRKQRAAPPGLVWYTQAKTLVVPPLAVDCVEGSPS